MENLLLGNKESCSAVVVVVVVVLVVVVVPVAGVSSLINISLKDIQARRGGARRKVFGSTYSMI